MLIYSENRLVPTDVNMMTIRAKDNIGYFYIHRSLYDQAVVIDDIYASSPEQLRIALTGKSDKRDDIEEFENKAPKPLAILGNFLLLVEAPLETFEDMVGAIHVMSGPINLRNMLKVPFDMRNTPTFSLSIREEYQLAWDRFFQNTMPYSDDMFFQRAATPMNGTQTVTEPVDGELSNIGDDGVEYEDPLMALLMGCDDDIFDVEDTDESGNETEKSSTVEESSPAPVVEPVPVATSEPSPAPVVEPVHVASESKPTITPERAGIQALLDIDA